MSKRALQAAHARISANPRSVARAARLGKEERAALVETLVAVIGGLYTHLPQKRASYGHDPVQRLRLLQQRLDAIGDDELHQSLAGIITDLRDAHTRYIGPTHVEGAVAFLPVLVERYSDRRGDHYIVTKVFAVNAAERRDLAAQGFVPEVEITHWNGMPIARAVDLHAERETGGRPDARRARALETLTLRPLRYALPPYEDWVIVTYVHASGDVREVKLTWRFARESDKPVAMMLGGPGRYAYAGNPAAEASRRVKKMLFATDVWHAGQDLPQRSALTRAGDSKDDWLTGRFQDAVAARIVETASGSFGHLRLWTFDVNDDDGFIAEIRELLRRLPRNGLIVDLRGNPGGLVWAAERMLQLFTPNPIEPARFSMLATDLTRALAAAPQSRRQFEPWRRSLDHAVNSGELYSRGVPLTPLERCNDIGQQYPGPVVAVVDANTYSAGDLFAAGFVDNRVGTLVSVDDATGAGGANVWYPDELFRALEGTPAALQPLPDGISFTVAVRRALRVGAVAETGIEDVGVAGHMRHELTRLDLTQGNRDLLSFCARLLASEPITDLSVSVAGDALTIDTLNLDRVDIYVDDRPTGAPHAAQRSGTSIIRFELDDLWSRVDVVGFAGAIVRQRRRLQAA